MLFKYVKSRKLTDEPLYRATRKGLFWIVNRHDPATNRGRIVLTGLVSSKHAAKAISALLRENREAQERLHEADPKNIILAETFAEVDAILQKELEAA